MTHWAIVSVRKRPRSGAIFVGERPKKRRDHGVDGSQVGLIILRNIVHRSPPAERPFIPDIHEMIPNWDRHGQPSVAFLHLCRDAVSPDQARSPEFPWGLGLRAAHEEYSPGKNRSKEQMLSARVFHL